MKLQDDCIFCRIVRGEVPCFQVCEDDRTLTFMDIFPVAEGHTLVITKEHFSDIFEVDGETLAAVAAASLRVAQAIRRALNPDGLGVFQLNGSAAGQSVFHYHMHRIERAHERDPTRPLLVISPHRSRRANGFGSGVRARRSAGSGPYRAVEDAGRAARVNGVHCFS
jgi:histidine triad (HIT) family protein